MRSANSRVLVIKLGALGDFVLALGAFAAIRAAHATAHVTLLTTAPYVELARASGCFDAVWTDQRPSFLQVNRWLGLRARLRDGRFQRVYDLQTSDRSGWYFRLMGPQRPEWSGIAPGCSHPHANPRRDFMHSLDRQAEQLAAAGIAEAPPPDLSWARADIARFGLPARYAILAPGGAAHRPEKRWPAERFAALARVIAARGATPAMVGGGDEIGLADTISGAAPQVRNLVGETSLLELATIARGAAGAVGNDTGPMHVAAVAGCPTVVLFSAASDPALTAPRGSSVVVLAKPSLSELSLDEVAAALRLR
ncbi:MAG TPA: glycosyltransferase family 9 protein [Alphaproteobacteria bacterium]